MGEKYTYATFMAKLEERKRDMNPAQKAALKQRLDLLETFTQPAAKFTGTWSYTSHNTMTVKEEERFAPGVITIIDLSDPFVDPAMAGAIFEICIRLFQRASVDTGKVLVVDEAHKVCRS